MESLLLHVCSVFVLLLAKVESWDKGWDGKQLRWLVGWTGGGGYVSRAGEGIGGVGVETKGRALAETETTKPNLINTVGHSVDDVLAGYTA